MLTSIQIKWSTNSYRLLSCIYGIQMTIFIRSWRGQGRQKRRKIVEQTSEDFRYSKCTIRRENSSYFAIKYRESTLGCGAKSIQFSLSPWIFIWPGISSQSFEVFFRERKWNIMSFPRGPVRFPARNMTYIQYLRWVMVQLTYIRCMMEFRKEGRPLASLQVLTRFVLSSTLYSVFIDHFPC